MRIPVPSRHASPSITATNTSANAPTGDIGRFVGRRHELSEMLRMLESAEHASGGIVLLEGEPGIGKTRTAEEFAVMARNRATEVLWGRCYEAEECPPYGPWTAALRTVVQQPGFLDLWRTMGEERAVIAEILPELERHAEAGEPLVRLPSVDGEYRLHASLVAFLRAAARARPLLVVIDNLQLADAGSLKFLRRLAPELIHSRLMILATFRSSPEHPTEQVALTVEELQKSTGFRRLHLGGLCRDNVHELVRHALPATRAPEAVADAIHARTEGNPLFVVELLRQMANEPGSADGALPLPESIRQVIERRLRRLSHPCRGALRSASVLGRSFDRDILLRTADGLSTADVDGALREALQAAVISVQDPAVGRYRFVHALVQESLHEETPLDALTGLHLRAARAIEQACGSDPGPRSVEILAHLLQGAAAAEPHELIRCAEKAAAYAVAHYAPDHALALIDRTFRTWGRLGRGICPRMAGLYEQRAGILTDLQRPEEAREAFVKAFDLFLEAGDHRRAIGVALTPAMEQKGPVWLSSFGGSGRGIDVLRVQALALAPAGSRERAWLTMQGGSRRDFREAIDFAHRTGDVRLEATASSELAYHDLLAWEFEKCTGLLEAATRSADRLADPHVSFGCAYTRYWLGILTGAPEVAGEGLREMSNLAGRCRSRRLGITVHRCTADLARMRGDWAAARRHGEQALAMLPESVPVFNHRGALSILFDVELRTGNLKAAAQRLAALHRLTGEPAPDDVRSTLLGARITGDVGFLSPAPARIEERNADDPLLTFLPVRLLRGAAAAALLRDCSKARYYFDAARRWNGTFCELPTDSILAMLCDTTGRLDEAVDYHERAIALCRRAGYLPELAMTCSAYADTLVRRSSPADPEHAIRLLDQGRAICEALDMPQLGERIRQRRELLVGPELRDRTRTDGLTPREVEVIRLLTRGFTNAEIAERLFISPLTVARHVHNLLEKTGAANRAEAAAYAARSGER